MESKIIEFFEQNGMVRNFKYLVDKYGLENAMWFILSRNSTRSSKLLGENTTTGTGLIEIGLRLSSTIGKLVPVGATIRDLFEFTPKSFCSGISVTCNAYIVTIGDSVYGSGYNDHCVVTDPNITIKENCFINFSRLSINRTKWSQFERDNAVVFNWVKPDDFSEDDDHIITLNGYDGCDHYKWLKFSKDWEQLQFECKYKEFRKPWHYQEYVEHKEFYKDFDI